MKTCIECSGSLSTASNMATKCWWLSGVWALDKPELHFPAITEIEGTRDGVWFGNITTLAEMDKAIRMFFLTHSEKVL